MPRGKRGGCKQTLDERLTKKATVAAGQEAVALPPSAPPSASSSSANTPLPVPRGRRVFAGTIASWTRWPLKDGRQSPGGYGTIFYRAPDRCPFVISYAGPQVFRVGQPVMFSAVTDPRRPEQDRAVDVLCRAS